MKFHTLHVPGADPARDEIALSHLEFNSCIHEDPERTGVMPNFLGALRCALENDDQKWSVILQDDAVPYADWKTHLEMALRFSPSKILGLTYFGNATAAAAKKRAPYVVGPHTIWGGAVAYRQDVLEDLYTWATGVYEEHGYPHDDRLVSAFAQKAGFMPAVVTNAIFNQVNTKSLIGHSGHVEPAHTIEDGIPFYAGRAPHVIRSGAAKDQRDWLVSLGTADESPTHTFKVVRNGAVSWTEK